jgi:hypothetical protein
MNAQRALDLALMSEDQLDELEQRCERARGAAAEVGLPLDPGLAQLHVDVLVERSIRAQESSGRS